MPDLNMVNSFEDHAKYRQQNALCPKSLDEFAVTANYNPSLIESDLEIFITSCEAAASEKDALLNSGFTDVTGLPDQSRCSAATLNLDFLKA